MKPPRQGHGRNKDGVVEEVDARTRPPNQTRVHKQYGADKDSSPGDEEQFERPLVQEPHGV
jgi:hypothetical protein